MALTINSNTLYIPSGESNTDYTATNNKTIQVSAIWITPTSAGGSVVLYDGGTSNIKLSLSGATANDTLFFDLGKMPVIFPNGLRATSTNCTATVLFSKGGI